MVASKFKLKEKYGPYSILINNSEMTSNLLKMAAEFSNEISKKVWKLLTRLSSHNSLAKKRAPFGIDDELNFKEIWEEYLGIKGVKDSPNIAYALHNFLKTLKATFPLVHQSDEYCLRFTFQLLCTLAEEEFTTMLVRCLCYCLGCFVFLWDETVVKVYEMNGVVLGTLRKVVEFVMDVELNDVDDSERTEEIGYCLDLYKKLALMEGEQLEAGTIFEFYFGVLVSSTASITLDTFTHKDPTIPKIRGLLTAVYDEVVVISAQRVVLESSLLVFFLHHFQGDAAIKCLECFQPIIVLFCSM